MLKTLLMINNTIVYKNQRFSLDNIDSIDFDTWEQDEATVAFASRFSPLSDLHISSFEIDCIVYPSVEHFYQHTKCRFMKKTKESIKVLRAIDPETGLGLCQHHIQLL